MKKSSPVQQTPNPTYPTLDDWVRQEAIPFSLDSAESLNTAIDRVMASIGDSLQLLGFGEALHGGEELLVLRNRLFQRLVEAHGFSAIAVESSFPRGRLVNEYIAGHDPASYEAVQESGFSHGFGQLEANRELIEWMQQYNATPSRRVTLQFYGFDSPTEMMTTDSPRQLLQFALDYLAPLDSAVAGAFRGRIEPLLGQDAAWENPTAALDPSQSIGLSPEASQLRLETEELIAELRLRRPEWVAKSDESRFLEALHYASLARQLLTYHAGVARPSEDRLNRLLGLRDTMMADNLAYMVARERGQGKVLAFAHNSHLRRGQTQMQLGPYLCTWWPAGAHLNERFGRGYVVIASGLGASEANGLAQPEAGTLEALLTTTPGPARFIPTHQGQGLPPPTTLPIRSGSLKNPGYFPLTPQHLTDFDWLAVLDSGTYSRGGPPLPQIG